MHDVARLAGVSLGSVSHVINHPERVSAELRARVLQAIETLGFVPNGSARQLRVGKTRSLGLVVLDVANPFFTEVARGVEDAASEYGFSVILCNSDSAPVKEEAYLRTLEEQRVAGILITPISTTAEAIEQLRQRGTAVVLLDSSGGAGVCSVAVDDTLGGKLAGDYLLSLGHESIGYIHGPLTTRQYADRLLGLRQAALEHGCDPEKAIVLYEAQAVNAHAGVEMATQIHAAPHPRALFCGNDFLAIGMMYGLSRLGVRVPQDIAIIGYDDIDLAAMQAVPLTTIRQPKYELGYTAARLLMHELADPHQHQQIVYRPELIIRDSAR